MKKLALFVILTMSLMAETVVVDMNYMISNHPKFKETNVSIESEKTRLETLINEKASKLQEEEKQLEAKGDKRTQEEIDAFTKKDQELQKFYSQSQSNLLKFKNDKMNGLYSEIMETMTTMEKVKKDLVIVDKNAVYIGSEKLKDISDEVLKTLKSSEKISLK